VPATPRNSQESEPWERQPGESLQAYEAFKLYRDNGANRSARAVGQQLAKSWSLISRWSSRNHWVRRAAQYDRDQERRTLDQLYADWDEYTKRQTTLAGYMTGAVARWAEQHLKDDKAHNLDVNQAMKLLDLANKMERQARQDRLTEHTRRLGGGSTNEDDGFDVDNMSDEELRDLARQIRDEADRMLGDPRGPIDDEPDDEDD